MSEKLDYSQIEQLIRTFIEQARLELKERWKKWVIDLSQSELHEVVGALLARQVTLARQMAVSPQIWNDHIAPIILRAMADVYISLVWILKDPVDRSRKFVLYGLGQAKLELEHHKVQIGDRKLTPEEKMWIEASEAWINSQRFTFLTEVNVGSWSGIPTRQMAEEADCIDFYNYVYNPFSACTHSMWHHVARYNLRQCANPLHQDHQVPEDPELPMDPYNLYLAAKYLQKTFTAFDEKFSIQVDVPSAYEHLCESLDKLSSCEDKQGKEKENHQPDSINKKRNTLLYLLPMVLVPLIAGLVVITMVNKKAGVSRPERTENHENSTIIKTTLRDKTEKGLSPDTVQIMLGNKGIFDSRRNPSGPGISHKFEAQSGGTVVYDRATGLLWQQSGSQSDMNYERAKNYISELNHEQFASYNDWRLPTLEEAMSLMEPAQKNSDLHIDRVFDPCQVRILTSDFRRDSMSWVVRFDSGYCDYVYNDSNNNYSVRVVR